MRGNVEQGEQERERTKEKAERERQIVEEKALEREREEQMWLFGLIHPHMIPLCTPKKTFLGSKKLFYFVFYAAFFGFLSH